MNINEREKTELFTAELVNLYVSTRLTDYQGLADNLKIRHAFAQSIEGMVLQLTTWCAAGRIPDLVRIETVEYPNGVWQTFKALHMPNWFRSWFPVRMIEKTFEVQRSHYFVCPHVHVPPGDHLHIQFMATGTSMAEKMSK